MITKLIFFIPLFILFSLACFSQDKWNKEQEQIIYTMDQLSETTSSIGKGADAYADYLSDDFSRWTIGSSVMNDKIKWVEGVREWFDEGWRVSEKQQQNLEILIMKDIAHTCRVVSETYIGPAGDISKSKAALAEIWIKKKNRWLLHRVNVHPIEVD